MIRVLLIIIGNIFLSLGLYFSFGSNRIVADKMYRLKRGQQEPLIKPQVVMDKEQSEGDRSDQWYHWGMLLNVLGIFLNTIGSLM